ncbi:hypothetical protein ABIE67_009627 [Streptomyces sp. V4I8]
MAKRLGSWTVSWQMSPAGVRDSHSASERLLACHRIGQLPAGHKQRRVQLASARDHAQRVRHVLELAPDLRTVTRRQAPPQRVTALDQLPQERRIRPQHDGHLRPHPFGPTQLRSQPSLPTAPGSRTACPGHASPGRPGSPIVRLGITVNVCAGRARTSPGCTAGRTVQPGGRTHRLHTCGLRWTRRRTTPAAPPARIITPALYPPADRPRRANTAHHAPEQLRHTHQGTTTDTTDGTVTFEEAEFTGGKVAFGGAQFTGSTITFVMFGVRFRMGLPPSRSPLPPG